MCIRDRQNLASIDFPKIVYAFFSAIGYPVIGDTKYSIIFGITFITLFCVSILRSVATGTIRSYLKKNSVWLTLILFAILVSAEIALGRGGVAPRHVYLLFIGWVGLYAMYSGTFVEVIKTSNQNKKYPHIVLYGAVLTIIVLGYGLTVVTGIERGENWKNEKEVLEEYLKTYKIQPDVNLKRLHPSPKVVRDKAAFLENNNFNVFTNCIYLYSPTSAYILPQQKKIFFNVNRINGVAKYVLSEHPITNNNRSIIAFENITIPQNAKLKFSTALDPAVWDPNKGDGVVFEVFIKHNGKEEKVFSKYIDPKHNPEERKWNDFEVDLSKYAGKNVTIIFSTLPGPNNDSRWDWAWWGEPRIEIS